MTRKGGRIIAWLFFRASGFGDAMYIITHLFKFQAGVIGVPQISGLSFVINFVLVGLLIGIEAADFTGKKRIVMNLFPSQRVYRYTMNVLLVTAILLLGVFEEQTFIYFQF